MGADRKPRFKVGNKVRGKGVEGEITKVWTVNPNVYRYTIKTKNGLVVLNEDDISRA